MTRKIFTSANINIINKSLIIFTALAVVLWSIGAGFFIPEITRAAVSQTTAPAGMAVMGQTIKASSVETPVIKFQLTGNSADNTVTQVTVTVESTAGPTVSGDFASLKVFKSADGIFDGGDTLVGTQTTVNVGSATNITVVEPPLGAAASWYIVTAATSAGAGNAHAFKVTMAANTAVTVGGAGAGLITSSALAAGSVQALTTDTVAPTLNVSMTGPATGSTNVPVSTFVHMGFSESLDQSTLIPANITFTSGGSPVGAGIKPFPDGFDLTTSNAPTYTTGTSFSKALNTSTAFYHMSGTNAINPQGAYVAPTLGDIVFFQKDTFPMDVGVITNATLASGTFGVNDFNLFQGQQITKFGTIAATGLQGSATTLVVGDIVVANVSANPTDMRYNWHIVTAGTAVNDAALRFDSVTAAAPTFVTTPSSRISRITPTATTTVNVSSQLSSMTFVAGDLVFAKVTAGADNLNQYAWHTVTTGETISGTVPSVLRLDCGATCTVPVTFTPSTQVSKLSAAATGAVTDTTTALSFGDIVMAKTTLNASNNGNYNFHMVSAGATGASAAGLRFDNASTNLSPSVTYVATAGVGVKDSAGNPLAAPATISFTTGSNTGTVTTPPFVQSSTPQGGSVTFPIGVPISLQFSVPMANTGGGSVLSSSNIGLFTNVNGAPGVAVTAANGYDSVTNTVTVTPSAVLTAATSFIVKIFGSTTSSTGTFVSPYQLFFTTASGAADTARPTITGVFPSPGATGVVRPVGDISIGFSEDMNAATISGTTITINNSITGTVTYNAQQRAAHFAPNIPLAQNTAYTVTVGTAVTDLSGNGLAGNGGVANAVTIAGSSSAYVFSFTTANTANETVKPTVQSANADNFGVAVTFSEPIKSGGGPAAADNIANYTLESPVGTSISLGGKTVTYDGPTMTARITGLSLQNGALFKITASNIMQDLAGNSMETVSSANVSQATVASSTMTGGLLGPGGGMMQTGGMMGMSPIRVSPMNRLAGATSGYFVEMPVTTSIPLGASIVLTFPTGFDVTNAAAMTAVTESPANSDINGPATGVVTIASTAVNISARTITIVTGGAETGANTFLRFDLKTIVNSTVPNSAGYTVDIKTKTAANVILETQTSSFFFLGQAGTNTLTVTVFNDNGEGGVTAGDGIKSGTEPGIASATVFLFSMAVGGQSGTTDVNGVATFPSLVNGTDYMVGIEPSSVTAGGFSFNSAHQPLSISGNTAKSFGLRAAPHTIAGTITGPINTKVDVFASGFNGYTSVTVDTGAGGSVAYSLPAQASTTYRVGVSPSMPRTFMQPGSAMPPPPTFTFMPPPMIEVAVAAANVTGKNFALTATDKTIAGTVKDSAGVGINKAQVFARPVQTSSDGTNTGFGTGGETDTQGNFSLRVTPGVYLVGVFKPGMPNVQEKQITVATVNTPATLAFVIDASTSLTISGKVTDDAGNAVAYAGVGGRRVTSTTNTTSLGGDSGNFVGGPTDANGAYTLYVTAGTWVIEAYAPGFGRLGTKTVTVVAGTSLTGQDFSAATLSVGTITGQATKATVAQQGVMVRADGANGGNMAITDVSGNYTLKVPAGTGYTINCYFPGVGEATPLTGVTVTSGATSSGNNCSLAAPITVTVNVTNGTSGITGAFVDARDTNGRGNGTNSYTTSGANAVYVLTLSPGTYTVRAGHPSYGMLGSTLSVSTTQTITYTAAAGATFAVTGTATGGGVALSGAWVSVTGTSTGQTNIIHVGGQTASNGTFSISVPNGTYKVRVDKPGYKSPTETGVTVAGATISVGTIALSAATLSITGKATLDAVGVSGAFVDATDGAGGFTVDQTDANGNYTLAVNAGNWTVRAHSQGYDGGPLLVAVGATNVSGQDVALSAISGFTVQAEKQETVTPSSGGFFTNTNIGAGFKLNIPANALGTGANASTVKTQINTAMPNPPTGSILKKNAVSISAVDAAGALIKTLSDAVTVVIPYTESDIPSGIAETSLVIGVWNEATSNYDTLPTTVDTTANTLTATVSHFSDFAPLVPTNPTATATPTGFTVGGATSSTLLLSWTLVSGASGYDIYRSATTSGTYARLGSEPTVSSGSTVTYTDTGLSAYTAYYYKISSVSTGNESAATEYSSGTTLNTASSGGGGSSSGGGGGGYAAVSTPAATTTVTPVVPVTSAVPTTTPAVPATPVTPAVLKALPYPSAKTTVEMQANLTVLLGNLAALQAQQKAATLATPVTPSTDASVPPAGSYKVSIAPNSKGNDVTALQNFLKSQGADVYPEGLVTGYFGNLTKAAVGRFQIKQGIVTSTSDVGYGNVGPKTRAKINSLLGL